jgi:hypothetical protein
MIATFTKGFQTLSQTCRHNKLEIINIIQIFRCTAQILMTRMLSDLTSKVSPCRHVYDKIKHIRGPFAKFVDSPYYSESEHYGGAVTVSFSKYLPWQAIHFLKRSTYFSKTCCRPLTTSKFLTSELPFHD